MALTPAELNAAQAQINAARDQAHTNINLAKGWAQIAQDAAEASGSGSAQVATAEANRAGQQKALAETARSGAEAARDTANTHRTAAQTARTGAETAQGLAEDARDRAEAVPATVDGLVPGLIDNPTSATRGSLEAIYGPPAIAPEAQFPAGIYNHPPTMQDAAAFAGIAPATMGMVQSILARNAMETPMPEMTFLVTGLESDAPRNLGGSTTTNVPSPTDPSRTVWRTVSAVGTTGNFRRYVTASLPPSVAVSAWVYLPEPEKIANVALRVWNDQGTSWQRDTSQTPISLVRGWNLIRMASRVSDPARLREVREVGVYATPVAGHAADYSVGIVALEHRPKASVVVINDWGSKPFLDNGYPSCKANNIPVTWGVRVNRMGAGTYPDNHISLAEAKMLMNENNNVMSFHSWNGGANSGYTEEEARQVVLLCQAGLSARGLWSEGVVHRPAWVQNLAPNARGAYPYLVTGGGHSDSYANTAWPPIERNNIPRWGVHGTGNVPALVDAHFAELQTTNGAALVYTHAVIPEANANHASQANWDYFVGKVTQGIADGWLEAVTIPQLVARERLELPTDPSRVPLPFEEPFDVQAALDGKEKVPWQGTQAQYDALGSYESDRTYYITD